MKNRVFISFGFPALVGLAILGTAGFAIPQQSAEIHVLPVQGNVYMLVGPGGNITVQAADEGVLLVDTQFAEWSPRVMAAIRTLSDGPVRWIINTHMHEAHTGGNGALSMLGMTGASLGPPRIIAHQYVLNRMTAEPTPEETAAPAERWPNDAYFTPSKDFFFNGEAVVVYHVPRAHTDGDSIVFFRRSDVISAGDIFTPGRYPVIDLERGGSIQGLIDGLNQILRLTVPGKYQEGGTYVIPGHGRLCDEADVVEYREMVTVIRDRIHDMIGKGMTLEQVKAARPTLDYDPEYGADVSPQSAEIFIEAAYRSLSGWR